VLTHVSSAKTSTGLLLHRLTDAIKLTTVANGAFLVVGLQTWNDLPDDVTSAESFRVSFGG